MILLKRHGGLRVLDQERSSTVLVARPCSLEPLGPSQGSRETLDIDLAPARVCRVGAAATAACGAGHLCACIKSGSASADEGHTCTGSVQGVSHGARHLRVEAGGRGDNGLAVSGARVSRRRGDRAVPFSFGEHPVSHQPAVDTTDARRWCAVPVEPAPRADAGSNRRDGAAVPAAGGADDNLRFIADELLPWIDARYPTVPTRILVGHSLGGLFALYAMGTRPDLFRVVVALSPPIWWNDGALSSDLAARIAGDTVRARTLFLASGGLEPAIDTVTSSFAARLQRIRDSVGGGHLRFERKWYPRDIHEMVTLPGLVDGLRMAFEPISCRPIR